jgi:hypothetical protein
MINARIIDGGSDSKNVREIGHCSGCGSKVMGTSVEDMVITCSCNCGVVVDWGKKS